MKYILTLDQGTTSSRAILFDTQGKIQISAKHEFPQYFLQSGWVEQNPEEIWESQLIVAKQVLEKVDIENVLAIGIANQRETFVVWDKKTGSPIYPAIVWQDRRSASICQSLKQKGLEKLFQKKTGLLLDPYFSGTKLSWLLDNHFEAKIKAENGELLFGTIDSWLVYKLTKGLHLTDITNASRTLLFNIHTEKWDDEILKILDVPKSILPPVHTCSEIFGYCNESYFSKKIPIAGIAGDQQAALLGQQCFHKGMVKNTYGTGCFLLMNTGETAIKSKHRLLTTPAWKIGKQTTYALEGCVFIAGALVQWLRDGLKLISKSEEVETLAKTVLDNGGIYFVPAFVGLGAPFWDPLARGLLIGLTRGSERGHIARAALEAIAFQTRDVLKAMQADAKIKIKELKVDGGASSNQFLMQFQSDLLQIPIKKPDNIESTALGAAYLAGLAIGVWKTLNEINIQKETIFSPQKDYECLYQNWQRAVERSTQWLVE